MVYEGEVMNRQTAITFQYDMGFAPGMSNRFQGAASADAVRGVGGGPGPPDTVSR